jgi:hypothetical protein
MKATKLLGRKRGRVKKMKLKLETSAWEGERKTTVGSPIRGRRQSAISNQRVAPLAWRKWRQKTEAVANESYDRQINPFGKSS